MKQPSEAQKRAGNYPKQHINVHGLRISIETPAGAHRSGVSPQGKRWRTQMKHDYGYIRGTQGRDKDHLDVFLGPDHTDPELPVHVVDQVDPATGTFDEHKVMLGFKTPEEAESAYKANYEPGWRGAAAVTPLSLQEFKFWAGAPGRRVKPAAEVQKFAEGGAVFGHYPHLKRRSERNNDREGAKDLPVQAARGWAAGTLGLPGDLEGLARTLFKLGAAPDSWRGTVIKDEPALPTTEFYKEWLPGATQSKTAGLGTELGSLFGGAGSTRAAGAALRGAKAAGAGVGAAIDAGMQPGGALARAFPAAQPMFAVKPKGGNWDPTDPWEMLDDYVFGNQGRGARDPVAGWREKQLQRYVKNLMGTPDDPLLKLEAEGRLHLDPRDLHERALEQSKYRPIFGGDAYKPTLDHTRLTGRYRVTPWEALSDSLLDLRSPGEVRTRLGGMFSDVPRNELDGLSIAEMMKRTANPGDVAELGEHAWLDKLPDGSPLWAASLDPREGFAGFEHVNDYLKAALKAQEDLNTVGSLEAMAGAGPEYAGSLALARRGLHLTPEQLARTSVPDAVAKTSEWNKILAEAKALKDRNTGIKAVHRQYPETGYQWVELSPEGLQAEGDAMRHCVGGYCSEVASGDTRILSLRGKDGKPAVTVELAKGRPWNERSGIFYDNPELESFWHQYHQEKRLSRSSDNASREDYMVPMGMKDLILDYPDWLKATHPEVHAKHAKVFEPDPVSIRQIKGPANRAPSKDVLPHVQDLVRNGLGGDLGNWGEVRDLGNTGLYKVERASGRSMFPEVDMSPAQRGTLWDNYGRANPQSKFATQQDVLDWFKDNPGAVDDGFGYAHGGSVHAGPKLTMSAFEQSVYDADVPWAEEGSPLDAQMDKFQLDAENRARGYADGGEVEGGSGPEPGEPTGAEVEGPGLGGGATGGQGGFSGNPADAAQTSGIPGSTAAAATATGTAPTPENNLGGAAPAGPQAALEAAGMSPQAAAEAALAAASEPDSEDSTNNLGLGAGTTPATTAPTVPDTNWSPLGFLVDLFISMGIPFGGLINAGVRGATGTSLGGHLTAGLPTTPGVGTPSPNEPGEGADPLLAGTDPGGATEAPAPGALSTVGLPSLPSARPAPAPALAPVQVPFVPVTRSRRPALQPSTQWDGLSGLAALNSNPLQ